MLRKYGIILGVGIMLGACSASGTGDVKTYSYGQQGGARSAGAHVVSSGDTVYGMAQRYRLDMRDIITANNLQAPYHLNPGQHLMLPPPREYKVRAGDSLYSISRLFGVGVTDIARLNNLRAPYAIATGSTVRLPATAVEETVARQHVAVQGTRSKAAIERETLSGTTNGSPSTGGQKVATPAGQKNAVPQTTAQTSKGTLTAAEQTKKASAPVSAPDVRPANQASKALEAKVTKDVPARSSSKFLRPVSGKVVSTYGPKAGGMHNDGINIAAPRGTPVLAAENGVVVYASNEMKGYGNMILIRHADRWMTAYAHMDGVKVARGDTVKRGQAIGTVGATGSVDGPQLHFEIRRGVQALNPEIYIDGSRS